jgi:hypothetical protein
MHHFYRNPTIPPRHVLQALRSGVRRAENWSSRHHPLLVKPDMLTPEEIAALRQRAKERSAYYRKAFAHLRLKPAVTQPEPDA